MGARSGWRDLGDMGRVVLEGRLRDDSRMAAHVTHVFGDMEPATVGAISELLDELDHATDEHPDVAISDESGWTLAAHRDGLLVWENVEEDDEPRHIRGVARGDAQLYFRAVAEGDLASVEALPWLPGYS